MQPLRCSPGHSPELKRKLKRKLKAGDSRAVAMVQTVAVARALELFIATERTESQLCFSEKKTCKIIYTAYF